MVFSSQIFLFAFLPCFLGAYWASPERFKNLTILVFSYLFYGWWRIDFLFLFIAITLWNYLIAFKIYEHSKWALRIGIIGNLLALGFFKYANFGVEALNQLFAANIPSLHIILPIGISFYIFQAMSFLVDSYRKDAPKPSNFIDFAAFISFFPQLIAGPVIRYKDIADQFKTRVTNAEIFLKGIRIFIAGLGMKTLLADPLAPFVDAVFSQQNPGFVDAWLGALAYSFQLFFDFAGYSSMAIGLGKMLGFDFPQNFNNPYIARSITEFWRRWHMSLSSWLRDYLYIPLGGNRGGAFKTYRNIFLTMLIGGFWHGANWTFLIWGAWHGGWMVFERMSQRPRHIYSLPLTFIIILIGWVFFRSDTVTSAFSFLKAMGGLNGFTFSDEIYWQFGRYEMAHMLIAMIALRFMAKGHSLSDFMLSLIFMISLITILASSFSPFLYFQF